MELQRAIDACQPGDELLIPKLDRLGRTMEDCVSRVAELLERDVHVRTLDGRVDTKGLGTMAKPVVGVLAAAVQVERELSMERSREGIQAARNKGVPFGPSANTPTIRLSTFATCAPRARAMARSAKPLASR